MKKRMNTRLWLAIALFIISFLIRAVNVQSMGDTFDEKYYYSAGHDYILNIKHLNWSKEAWENNKEHPPIAKYFYGLTTFYHYNPNQPDYRLGRVMSALFSAGTVTLTYLIGLTLTGGFFAFIAALGLAIEPTFFAYGLVFGLDSPTVFFFTLTVYTLLKALRHKKIVNYWYLATALSLGLAISTRFNNLLLFLLIPIIILIYKWREIIENKKTYFWLALGLIFVPIVCFYLVWPWLWFHPIVNFRETLGHWGPVKEIFLGKIQVLPWYYYFYYYAVKVPTIILLLVGVYLFSTKDNPNKFFLLAWLVVPFLMFVSQAKQDGARYILAVYPPTLLMATLGTQRISQLWSGYKKDLVKIVAGILLICYLATITIIIHPYYLDFYNFLSGGVKTVSQDRDFEFNWWGEGATQAMDWLNQNAKPNSTVGLAIYPDHTLGYDRRSDLKFVFDSPQREEADYLLVNYEKDMNDDYKQKNKDILKNYHLVYEVKAAGVPLVWIYQKSK